MVIQALFIQRARQRLSRHLVRPCALSDPGQQQNHEERRVHLVHQQEAELEARRRARQAKLKEESTYMRILRDNSNPWKMEEGKFMKKYRFTPHLAMALVDLLHDDLTPKRPCEGAIPSYMKTLVGLTFFGHGDYQDMVGSDYKHPCSQPTVSKIISQFTNAVLKHSKKFISFSIEPQSGEERLQRGFFSFRAKGAMERTLFLIDCTHFDLAKPWTNERCYYNGHHCCGCILCEVTCDSDYTALSVKLFPGGNHDQFLWKNSKARKYAETLRLDADIRRREGRYYGLADEGYTLSPILMVAIKPTPPPGSAEARFNSMVLEQRYRVEHLFGQLKESFRCLNKERMLHYKPKKACAIIKACFVLFNFKKLGGTPLEPARDVLEMREDIPEIFSKEAGVRERNALINRYYS